MKPSKLAEFVMWLIGAATFGALSYAVKDVMPTVSGMFAGLSIFLILCAIVERRYIKTPNGPIIVRSMISRLGIWPVGMLVILAFLLMYLLSWAPFLLGFLETIITATCFMYATLAVIAQNPDPEGGD